MKHIHSKTLLIKWIEFVNKNLSLIEYVITKVYCALFKSRERHILRINKIKENKNLLNYTETLKAVKAHCLTHALT